MYLSDFLSFLASDHCCVISTLCKKFLPDIVLAGNFEQKLQAIILDNL